MAYKKPLAKGGDVLAEATDGHVAMCDIEHEFERGDRRGGKAMLLGPGNVLALAGDICLLGALGEGVGGEAKCGSGSCP